MVRVHNNEPASRKTDFQIWKRAVLMTRHSGAKEPPKCAWVWIRTKSGEQGSKRGAEASITAVPSNADVEQAGLGALSEKSPMSVAVTAFGCLPMPKLTPAARACVRKPSGKEPAGSRAPGTAQRYEDFARAISGQAAAQKSGRIMPPTEILFAELCKHFMPGFQ